MQRLATWSDREWALALEEAKQQYAQQARKPKSRARRPVRQPDARLAAFENKLALRAWERRLAARAERRRLGKAAAFGVATDRELDLLIGPSRYGRVD